MTTLESGTFSLSTMSILISLKVSFYVLSRVDVVLLLVDLLATRITFIAGTFGDTTLVT